MSARSVMPHAEAFCSLREGSQKLFGCIHTQDWALKMSSQQKTCRTGTASQVSDGAIRWRIRKLAKDLPAKFVIAGTLPTGAVVETDSSGG